MSSVTPVLSEAQFDQIRAEVVASILAEKGRGLTLISKAQAAGLLDIDPKTLDSLPIKRVVIVPRKIAYRLSDIEEYIQKSLE